VAEVVPTSSLKGDAGTAPITYSPNQAKMNCGLNDLPTVTGPGVYYANRTSDGQLQMTGMLNAESIKDEALVRRYFEALDMEPHPLGPPIPAPPSILQQWPWLAGTACLSLLAGIWIGRSKRKASDKQKLHS
jgi:hypothetical protein